MSFTVMFNALQQQALRLIEEGRDPQSRWVAAKYPGIGTFLEPGTDSAPTLEWWTK